MLSLWGAAHTIPFPFFFPHFFLHRHAKAVGSSGSLSLADPLNLSLWPLFSDFTVSPGSPD